MYILELPIELLQLTIDLAVQHTDLQHAVKFRETCRQFNEVVQNSIFHLPKTALLQKRLSPSMRGRLVCSKMLRGNANELLLCYTINRTADYLIDCTAAVSRDRYVQVLEYAAVNTLIYWRLLDCLTTERQRYIPLEELKDNALVAAVGAGEITTVQSLLEEGANPASNTPLFGEPLAMAASFGSLDIVQLLLARWDWEDHVQLTGLRLVKAIEAAAVAGQESVLAQLFDHKDRIAWFAYEDAIIRMIEYNQIAFVERLLALWQANTTSKEKEIFWLRVVRTAAEYNRQTLLQQILAENLSDIWESSLETAMQDACRENHGDIVKIIIPHLSVSDQTRHHHDNSVFWAAWYGNVETLQHLLTFLQSDRRSLLVAFAGAVSGKASKAIKHLFKVAGISPIGEHIAIRFTDIACLMLSDMIAEPTEPLSAPSTVLRLCQAAGVGELSDVINISNALQVHHPNNTLSISTAFSSAARKQHLDVLLFLCENWTPFLESCWVRTPAVAQIFIDLGCDINQQNQGSGSLRLGRFMQDKSFTRWLLEKGAAADGKGEFEENAVAVAMRRASIPTIKLLLNRGSGIRYGQLLHFAVQRKVSGLSHFEDSREIVELLLNLGYPIDSIWSQDGSPVWLNWGVREAGTALFAAAEQGRDDMVAYLLSRGADATLISDKGRTALDAAKSKQHSSVVQLLRR